jgi:phosphatidylglycerol lysyltransferase
MPFSKASLMTIIMVLIGCGWLGFFAYRDVQYAHELWWQFSYEGDAPRFLRALLLIIIVSVCYSLSRLLSVAPPQLLKKPNEEELNQAKAIIMHSEQIDGFLALLGDKYLFWNAERDAFIMFAISGQFWIAMGDPIGNTQSFESLLWQFREQADYYAADSVFYQVSADYLPFYLDLGLSLFKLGEEANIDLTNFSLQGRRYKNLRGSHNKFMTMGYHSQIIKAVDVIAVLPQLQKISNNWLAHKNTKEKGFSLGFFNEAYLARTDIIVIKDTQGDIKAFANIWQTTNREQLSVDLMRYEVSSPNGIMDFLFAELLLWGKAENYHWFSLGMAPLAGLEHHALSPLWHKIGALIFNMGDWFYNFEGLYDYKAKFAPHWSPRYLAVSAGLSVPFILLIITRLIAGGWKGVFSK